MQLNKSVDFDAPRDAVFRVLADFDHWERAALRRNVDIQRLDMMQAPAAGMAWKSGFAFRGKRRDVELRVERFEPDRTIALAGTGKAMAATVRLDLAEMGPRRTRLTVVLDVTARTLPARLLLQSLRLARGRVRQTFDSRVDLFATEVANRLRSAPRGA